MIRRYSHSLLLCCPIKPGLGDEGVGVDSGDFCVYVTARPETIFSVPSIGGFEPGSIRESDRGFVEVGMRGFRGGNADGVGSEARWYTISSVGVGLSDEFDESSVGPDRVSVDGELLVPEAFDCIPDLFLYSGTFDDQDQEFPSMLARGALDTLCRKAESLPSLSEINLLRRRLYRCGNMRSKRDRCTAHSASNFFPDN